MTSTCVVATDSGSSEPFDPLFDEVDPPFDPLFDEVDEAQDNANLTNEEAPAMMNAMGANIAMVGNDFDLEFMASEPHPVRTVTMYSDQNYMVADNAITDYASTPSDKLDSAEQLLYDQLTAFMAPNGLGLNESLAVEQSTVVDNTADIFSQPTAMGYNTQVFTQPNFVDFTTEVATQPTVVNYPAEDVTQPSSVNYTAEVAIQPTVVDYPAEVFTQPSSVNHTAEVFTQPTAVNPTFEAPAKTSPSDDYDSTSKVTVLTFDDIFDKYKSQLALVKSQGSDMLQFDSLEEALAAQYQVNSDQADNTIPTTIPNKKFYVSILRTALDHMDGCANYATGFGKGKLVYSNAQKELACWQILESVIHSQVNEVALQDAETKAYYPTFYERFKDVAVSLARSKLICKSVTSPAYTFALTDAPIAAFNRKDTNKEVNDHKGEVLRTSPKRGKVTKPRKAAKSHN